MTGSNHTMSGLGVRKLVVLAALGVALAGWSPRTFASSFFDPTGTGSYLATPLENLDWSPGSLLAQNQVTAINNFVSGSGSTSFVDYYQAKLGTYSLTDGTTATMATGSLSIVMGLSQHVTAVTGTPGTTNSTATFAWDASPKNWLEVYYNPAGGPTVNDQIQGTNFNQGQLVLRASITAVNNLVLTVDSGGSGGGLLDQSGHGLYPSINTMTAHGSTQVTAQMGDTSTGWWDPNFFNFTDGPVFANLTMVQNVGLDTPFFTTVPSSGFVDSANLGAIGSSGPTPNLNIGPGTTGVNPLTDGANTVGTDNGVTGPDTIFQSDTNEFFSQTQIQIPGSVPEPLTASLGALGLLGLAFGTLRRRRA